MVFSPRVFVHSHVHPYPLLSFCWPHRGQSQAVPLLESARAIFFTPDPSPIMCSTTRRFLVFPGNVVSFGPNCEVRVTNSVPRVDGMELCAPLPSPFSFTLLFPAIAAYPGPHCAFSTRFLRNGLRATLSGHGPASARCLTHFSGGSHALFFGSLPATSRGVPWFRYPLKGDVEFTLRFAHLLCGVPRQGSPPPPDHHWGHHFTEMP